MKIVNILLSVFIFLLAVAGAVFSYFLFEKRSQFVDGWNKMAAAIHQTATELDSGSGAGSLAAELTPDGLGHKSYAELDGKLPKLARRARQIILTRNQLAAALSQIGNAVGAPGNPDVKKLSALDTYEGESNKIVRAVSDLIAVRDQMYGYLIQFARTQYNVSLDLRDLQDGNTAALMPLLQAVQQEKARRATYESQLRTIAGYVGASLNTSEAAYAGSVQEIASAVRNLRDELRARENELKNTRDELDTRTRQLEQSRRDVADRDALLAEKQELIAGYRKALGIDDGLDDIPVWKRGSAEARAAIVAEVKEVHPDYGYIVINLGSDSRVKQQIGNRSLEIDPQIEKGLELVVVDPAIEKDGEFVARVVVDEVGNGYLTANIPADSKKIKPGYKVYWIQAKK